MPGPITTVVLADAQPVYRRYLRAFLEKRVQLHVVGEAEDAAAALRLVEHHQPDALLVDVTTPGLDGLETTRRISAEHPGVRVIALSLYADRQFVEAVLEAGASGFVSKDDAVDQLPGALREVAAGRVYRGAQAN